MLIIKKYIIHRTLLLLSILTRFLAVHSLYIITLLVMISSFILGDNIPVHFKKIVFTVSYILKELLIFILPILVLPLTVHSIVKVSFKGMQLIIVIFISVFISNFFSMFIAYVASYNFIFDFELIKNIKHYQNSGSIYSTISLDLYCLNIAVVSVLGIIIGLVINYIPNTSILSVLEKYYQFSRITLEKLFIIILPVYVAGSMLKITHEINFVLLIPLLGTLVVITLFIQSLYIGLLFFISTKGNVFKCILAIKNSIPAWLIGFSTMSSLITLPTTLKVVEKNTNDCPIAKLSIATTVNCHDIGDCISLPLIALAIAFFFNGCIIPVDNYLKFAVVAALTQFSAISVPGGSVIVMIPLFTKYLGFTEEMNSLIIAISICLESFGTSMNVLGNVVFSMIISKLYKKSK